MDQADKVHTALQDDVANCLIRVLEHDRLERSAIDCRQSMHVPVLPGLKAIAVDDEVQRLPVVEHFIAVMNQVERCAD